MDLHKMDDGFYWAQKFENNHLFLKRVIGNNEPDNEALGALVLDADQAALLLQVIEQHNQSFKFDDIWPQTMLGNTHDALSKLSSFLSSVKIEQNPV